MIGNYPDTKSPPSKRLIRDGERFNLLLKRQQIHDVECVSNQQQSEYNHEKPTDSHNDTTARPYVVC